MRQLWKIIGGVRLVFLLNKEFHERKELEGNPTVLHIAVVEQECGEMSVCVTWNV